MGLIFEALFSVAVLYGLYWAFTVWRSAAADRQAAMAKTAEERRVAELDAALQTHGRPLHCLNCDHRFPGPLPDTGCPNCHLSTLVQPEEDNFGQTTQVNSTSGL